MTIKEAAEELNKACKTEREKTLEAKIELLEKVIINLANRLDYLESRCN